MIRRRLTYWLIRLLGSLLLVIGIVVVAVSTELQNWQRVAQGAVAIGSGCWLAWNPRRHLPESYWEPPAPA
jgi:hypothetical protein